MEPRRDSVQAKGAEEKGPLWPITSMWTEKDVFDFICDIGYAKHAHLFRRNAIKGKDLPCLDAYDLQRLGVENMEEAIRLQAIINQTTKKTWYNDDNPNEPPNISYSCMTKNRMLRDPRLPPFTVPPLKDGEDLWLPPLPSGVPIINGRQLRLPYRDQGDRLYRYNLPVQSYHDHCMVLGRIDAWKMYNSKF